MVDLSRLVTHLQHLAMTAISVGPLQQLVVRPREARRRVARLNVYCCFDRDRDLDRAAVVRDAITPLVRSVRGPFDSAPSPHARHSGGAALDYPTLEQLALSNVTLVLIGSATASRRSVQRILTAAIELRHAIVGLFVHTIADRAGHPGVSGLAPFVPADLPFPVAPWSDHQSQLIALLDRAATATCAAAPRPIGRGAAAIG